MIQLGNARDLLSGIADDVFDSCVTDPPYSLRILGNDWDATGVEQDPAFWVEVLRVMKPGAHLMAFGSPRTSHRLACAIEDAGFEIRDQIAWLKGGAAMPKGGHLSPKIDKLLGRERAVVGRRRLSGSAALSLKEKGGTYGVGQDSRGRTVDVDITEPASDEAKQWDGWAYNFAPRLEPIVVARKPFKGSAVRNVLEYGTGALNLGGCGIPVGGGSKNTRWPPNALITHSAGCTESQCEPSCPCAIVAGQSGETKSAGNKRPTSGTGAFHGRGEGRKAFSVESVSKGDSGAADRYFPRFYWHGKAPKKEKTLGGRIVPPSSLASIKPWGLIEWLVKLTTQPGGYCLDPFVGGGTTQIACDRLGVRHYGCEMMEEHYRYAKRRARLLRQDRKQV